MIALVVLTRLFIPKIGRIYQQIFQFNLLQFMAKSSEYLMNPAW